MSYETDLRNTADLLPQEEKKVLWPEEHYPEYYDKGGNFTAATEELDVFFLRWDEWANEVLYALDLRGGLDPEAEETYEEYLSYLRGDNN